MKKNNLNVLLFASIKKSFTRSFKYLIINSIVEELKEGSIDLFTDDEQLANKLRTKPNVRFLEQEGISRRNNWDLIIFTSNSIIPTLQQTFPNLLEIPSLFISCSNTAEDTIPFHLGSIVGNLIPVSVFFNKNDVGQGKFDHPCYFQLSLFKKITAVNPAKKSFIYLQRDEDKNNATLNSVITAFNLLPLDYKLTIIASPDTFSTQLNAANENIQFISNKKISFPLDFKNGAILLTSSYFALEASKAGYPVIVVGERGYGGLLSPDNILFQFTNSFSGRISGAINEYIPPEVLKDEILFTLARLSNDSSFLQENQQLINQQLAPYSLNFLAECEKVICLFERIRTKEHIESIQIQLHPKVRRTPLNYLKDKFVLRHVNNKLISILGQEEAAIFESIGNSKTIQEVLVQNPSYEKEDMLSFLIELWNEKIIHLEV